MSKIDLTKIANSHIKPLDFDVIKLAVSGDSLSMKKIIEHYQPYLKALATKKLFDESGNEYLFMDEDMKKQLESKLMWSVYQFKI
ncbi:helix-turn-helix domain-containing protein [Acidaminobacter sp. JC074]|uniref:helix-turn-helix domain-containing protein n=1 Tax=Acidaminobacter sp. JC074 TaxID=2530199 RepID=UPI001F0E42C0|nr:helix-turn-helix domain-containing protein [Acidaminobacter sp. JC074]MCH4888913.1 helix-turn-helix domain-containing protein [Acidaminobacter sp. JC074]